MPYQQTFYRHCLLLSPLVNQNPLLNNYLATTPLVETKVGAGAERKYSEFLFVGYWAESFYVIPK